MLTAVFATLLAVLTQVSPDSVPANQPPRAETVLGLRLHAGLTYDTKITPPSIRPPRAVEVTFSRTGLSRRAWEQLNTFSRAGIYANYYELGNPQGLGETYGGGLFFEPLIGYGRRTYGSFRTNIGLTYVTRVFSYETNPGVRYFSAPLSAMIGLSASVHHQLGRHFDVVLTGNYSHISNAGSKQPNRGMNIPTVAVGLNYLPRPRYVPDTRGWGDTTTYRRTFWRILAGGSFRVLPDIPKDHLLPLFSLSAFYGYRLTRRHTLSGGFDYSDDRFEREVARRANTRDVSRQWSALLGYEFWAGRFSLTAHQTLVLAPPAGDRSYQRYGMLYRFRNGVTTGFHVRTTRDRTRGFVAQLGYQF